MREADKGKRFTTPHQLAQAGGEAETHPQGRGRLQTDDRGLSGRQPARVRPAGLRRRGQRKSCKVKRWPPLESDIKLPRPEVIGNK